MDAQVLAVPTMATQSISGNSFGNALGGAQQAGNDEFPAWPATPPHPYITPVSLTWENQGGSANRLVVTFPERVVLVTGVDQPPGWVLKIAGVVTAIDGSDSSWPDSFISLDFTHAAPTDVTLTIPGAAKQVVGESTAWATPGTYDVDPL